MTFHPLTEGPNKKNATDLKIYPVSERHLHLNAAGFYRRHISLIYQSSNLRWITRDILVLLSHKSPYVYGTPYGQLSNSRSRACSEATTVPTVRTCVRAGGAPGLCTFRLRFRSVLFWVFIYIYIDRFLKKDLFI